MKTTKADETALPAQVPTKTEHSVPLEIILQMIEGERITWRKDIEVYSIRYRVNKRLGLTDLMKVCTDGIEKSETALDELDIMEAEIKAEIDASMPMPISDILDTTLPCPVCGGVDGHKAGCVAYHGGETIPAQG